MARAILAGRRMVVVDELTQGLQPSLVAEVLAGLTAVAAAGVAVIVVDQHAGLMLDRCHRALVMEAGRLVLDTPVGPETRQRLDELLMVR